MEEQEHQRGCGYLLVVVLVIAGLLLMTGGGVILGWLITRRSAGSPADQPSPTRAGVRATEITCVSLNEDSAIVEAVADVKPAVVTVINTMPPRTDKFGQVVEPQASGSGVIIDERGYIVTNNHAVENSQSLEVIYADDTKVPATLVCGDVFSDLAVIKVEEELPPLQAAVIERWGPGLSRNIAERSCLTS